MPLVAGIDVGSVTAKTVLLDGNAQVLATVVVHQGMVNKEAAARCFQEALRQARREDQHPDRVVATGYGRHLVDFADQAITEITCHAKGVHALLPQVRTVIDVGGQDSKVIALDEEGGIITFRMNDKCAAGTGRFLEVMAQALGVPLEEMGELALQSRNPAQVSSTCTVFAESEMVSLSARGYPRVDIIAGMHQALGRRLVSMVRAVGLRPPVAMVGGVAKNVGVVRALEGMLGTPLQVPPEPQIVGALGAALFALQQVQSPAQAVR